MNAKQEKKQRLLELLERGMVMVHLDARTKGVCVPHAHVQNPAMALNLSYKFHIPDFRVDDDGVFASLSFDRIPFTCEIPWKALYAMRSHEDDTMHVWADDIPVEVMERAQIMGGETSDAPVMDTEAAVGDSDEPGLDDGHDEQEPGRATSVPYLRVIK